MRSANVIHRSDVDIDEVRAATGWELRVAENVDRTEPPSASELEALRELRASQEPAA